MIYFLIYVAGYIVSYFFERYWLTKVHGEVFNDRLRTKVLLQAFLSWFNVLAGVLVCLIEYFDEDKLK